MKAKKWLAAILLCAIIVTAFCGCGAKSQPQTDISSQSSISSQETVETVETVKKEEKPASMPSDVDKKESSSKSADTYSVNSDSNIDINSEMTDYDNDPVKREVKEGIRSFTTELFKTQYKMNLDKNENVFMSAFSVYAALSMLQNGALGETQSEMETVLGCSAESENYFFQDYIAHLQKEDFCFSAANSLWVNKYSAAPVKENFINNLSQFYNAEIFFGAPDAEMVDRINLWANTNTKGMIPSILTIDHISKKTVAVILNAVCFDAVWQKEYSDDDIITMPFNNYDGRIVERKFMRSTENKYLEDDNATGFIKYYKNDNKRYAFAALLPNEDINIDDYVSNYYTTDALCNMIDNSQSIKVYANLPKFTFETEYFMLDTLNNMGLETISDPDRVNLTNMAENIIDGSPVFINYVIHKAYIEVYEQGTKAAAVTAIGGTTTTSIEMSYSVTLDRPFLFAIYDCQEHLPLFTGVVKNFEKE